MIECLNELRNNRTRDLKNSSLICHNSFSKFEMNFSVSSTISYLPMLMVGKIPNFYFFTLKRYMLTNQIFLQLFLTVFVCKL